MSTTLPWAVKQCRGGLAQGFGFRSTPAAHVYVVAWHLSGTVFLNTQQRSRGLPVLLRHFLCPGHDQPPCLSACQHRPTDCKLVQYNNGPTPQVLSDLKTMLGVTSLGFEDNFQAEYYW